MSINHGNTFFLYFISKQKVYIFLEAQKLNEIAKKMNVLKIFDLQKS